MATIKEDYVSFETAKLLTEKGFDEPCFAYYYIYNDLEGKCLKLWRKFPRRPANTDYLNVPTQQMAMKWLREVYQIDIQVFRHIRGKRVTFYARIEQKTHLEHQDKCNLYQSYEQACEAAIKYCLENLI